MSSKFLKIIFAAVISVGLVGQSNAGLILGENYTDNDNLIWKYVGSYDMATGPMWSGDDGLSNENPSADANEDNATPYNGLEAAIAAGVTTGPLEDIAIAAFEDDSFLNTISAGDQIVNHEAWYDGAGLSITIFDEDILADGNGDGLYTKGIFSNPTGDTTDRSAWVNDRVFFSGDYVNYVFKRVSVPEPGTFVIIALALCGLGARRFKS